MLFDAEGLVFVLLLGFWLWALLDVIATEESLMRNLPKGLWIILVLVLFDIGALAWVLLGRPERGSWRPGSTDYAAPRKPVGLEDQPRYTATPAVSDRRSAELDAQLDQWEREMAKSKSDELEQREADLRRRELELRERELEMRERELGGDDK